MVELDLLEKLMEADYVMDYRVAANVCQLSYDMRRRAPDFFIALSVGGGAVSGGTVARGLFLGIDQKDAISDVDYGVIISKPINTFVRHSIHYYVRDELQKQGLETCSTFNAQTSCLIADKPSSMAFRMLQEKKKNSELASTFLAENLLLPYEVVFPFSEAKELQDKVVESLKELKKLDKGFHNEILEKIREILKFRRNLKKKHISDEDLRQFVNTNRKPYSLVL